MRVKNWEAALRCTIADWRPKKLAWGETDCAHFAADCAAAVAGGNPLADWAGQYDSQTGAARLLAARGFGSLGDAVAAQFEEIPPAMAHRGDLGVIDDALGGLVVVMGPLLVGVGDGDQGLVSIPRAHLKRAFKVG